MKIPAASPNNAEFEATLNAAQGGDAEARHQLAMHYLAANEFGRARRWFGRAGRQGHGPSLVQLGLIELRGLGLAASAVDAARSFEQAAAANDPEGHYQLAMLRYRGLGTAENRDRAAQHLIEAARGGNPEGLRTLAFIKAESGDQTAATQLFMKAAEAGDMFSQSAVAQRLARGLGIDAHPTAARFWAQQALAAGSYCQRCYHDLAQGDPIEASPLQSDFHADSLTGDLFAPIAARDGDRPVPGKPVRVYDDMYSHEECEYLIETAAPFLLPSHTVHPETGESVHNELRTSYGWSFHYTQEDIPILRVKERLAAQTGLHAHHAEPFAMLRYREGQEYRAHFDYIDPRSGEAGREIAVRGQRQQTIFSYLRTVPAGGETEFIRLGAKVAPVEGRAVHFHNVLEDGRPDPESLHASLPVIEGEKWLATLWFRDKPVNPS